MTLKNKRWVFVFALLSLCTIMAVAANKNAIKVYEADGSSEIFLLSKSPNVTIVGNELVLKVDDIEVLYPLTPSVRFEFVEMANDDKETGIQEITPSYKITANEIVISHVSPNSLICIYHLSGKMVKSARADNEGQIRISSLNLSKGTYIVKSEQVTFKIFIK